MPSGGNSSTRSMPSPSRRPSITQGSLSSASAVSPGLPLALVPLRRYPSAGARSGRWPFSGSRDSCASGFALRNRELFRCPRNGRPRTVPTRSEPALWTARRANPDRFRSTEGLRIEEGSHRREPGFRGTSAPLAFLQGGAEDHEEVGNGIREPGTPGPRAQPASERKNASTGRIVS